MKPGEFVYYTGGTTSRPSDKYRVMATFIDFAGDVRIIYEWHDHTYSIGYARDFEMTA